MNEFDAMDEVEVPDQWDDIVRRSEDVAVDLELDEPRGRYRWMAGGAIAAAVLAATLVAGLVALDRSDDHDTVVLDTAPMPEAGDARALEALDADPQLVCSDGVLAAGSLPEEAEFGAEPLFTASQVAGIVNWGWTVDGVTIQLNVPSIGWAAVGTANDAVDEPRGAFAMQPSNTLFIGESGLPPTSRCGAYDVMVAGGSDEQNRQTALDVARALEWVPTQRVSMSTAVVDEASMRSFALVVGGSEFVEGPHAVRVAVLEDPGDTGEWGLFPQAPPEGTRWIWSAVLLDGGRHLIVSVSDFGDWRVDVGSTPLNLDESPVRFSPALIQGWSDPELS